MNQTTAMRVSLNRNFAIGGSAMTVFRFSGIAISLPPWGDGLRSSGEHSAPRPEASTGPEGPKKRGLLVRRGALPRIRATRRRRSFGPTCAPARGRPCRYVRVDLDPLDRGGLPRPRGARGPRGSLHGRPLPGRDAPSVSGRSATVRPRQVASSRAAYAAVQPSRAGEAERRADRAGRHTFASGDGHKVSRNAVTARKVLRHEVRKDEDSPS